MLSRTWLSIGISVFMLARATAWGAAAVTYHGRLIGPDGQAVEASGVTFKIQVRSPGTANCLLYEESRTVDMRNSEGIFVIPIGDGSSSRTSDDPGITIEEVFSNGAVNHAGLTCNSGHAYLPATLDARKLVVTFNDGSGSGDQVLPAMDVNYVPFSLHAEEATKALSIGSTAASQVMSVASGAVTPLTAANFSELLLLVNGTSTAYVKTSSLPSCASGQVLKSTGGAFVCVTDATGADTLAGITCVDGKILKRVGGAWACADESGVGAENDPTVAAFAKRAPGAGLAVDGSNDLVPDFGTTAGKVAQGNDSRFTDSRAPNGSATGDLSGSYPNPTVAKLAGVSLNVSSLASGQVLKYDGTNWVNSSSSTVATDISSLATTGIVQRTGSATYSTLGVSAPLSNSGTNIGLSVGSGLTLNSGNLVPDFGSASGKVAQGNDSRFPSATCAGGNYSRWTGSAWSCDADNATDSTKVLKSGDTMTGSLALPSDGLVIGTNQVTVSGGNVGIGTTAATSKLTVSSNTTLPPVTTNVTPSIHIVGADASSPGMLVDGFGGSAGLFLRRADGTAAVPTPVQLDENLGQIVFGGYAGTAYQNNSGAKITASAAEPWSDTTGAAYLSFHTRPPLSTSTSIERVRIDSTGNVGIGTSVPSSTLQVAGSVATGFAAKSASYTLTASDSVVTGSASGGAITLTLPTAVGITGRQYTLKKVDSSVNAVSIATTSSQTIDGSASYSLATQYNYVTVVSDGANWNIIGTNIASGGGGSVDVQTFDTNGTWTKPSGAVSVRIDCWGGGGGGGRQNGGYASAGGGGGGGYSFKDILASSLPSTVAVTVGAGGAGTSSGGSGGQGGNSSFGSYLAAYGGAGGLSGGAWSSGGGGGGSMSAGSGGTPGAPLISAGDGDGSTPTYQGGGATNVAAVGALFHGGGGGSCYNSINFAPGASSFGGGGGGGNGYYCAASTAGGASGSAGSGGASANSGTAGAGSVPGGGGGGMYGSGTSGSGGSGRCIIKSF